ncbi:MAG: (2Fe-2S)-binding protein [Candidatus Aminicenantes bacterium]|nr:(2Fe-2S)-binding protein [Candidatus Aminicenantes bacterium]MDH5384995.1 (2Fe-2S)-binding protein [Candidatus Aminicenantes bacterium]MDH5742207.1 (2Fe-2S)-binding protein [Candidatus Aminicenantes bacterium]
MEKENKGNALTRRDFLKGFGTGALGAAVAPKLLAQEAESIQTKEGKIPVYSKKEITLTVNEKKLSMIVEPHETLLDVLRDNLNLTGAKKICDRGECGGCTVLLDGKPVYSCMYLAIRADGAKITTVEGLAQKDKLHPVQQAFIDKDAYQCGFCTPGFVMTSVSFLNKNQNPNLEDVKMALSGNLCRCGNYFKIYQAVDQAAKQMRRP